MDKHLEKDPRETRGMFVFTARSALSSPIRQLPHQFQILSENINNSQSFRQVDRAGDGNRQQRGEERAN